MSSRLLEWELSAGEQADLQLHLAVCPDCREELDSCYTLHRALVQARRNPAEPPRDLALHIMREVNSAPSLPLMIHRSKAALIRRLEEIHLVLKTPGRMRTAFSAAAVALVAVVAVGSLYLNTAGPLTVTPPKPAPVTTPAARQPTGSPVSQPAKGNSPPPTSPSPRPPSVAQQAGASTGTMTSVWVDARNLDALNQELSAIAGQHNAGYRVYSLNNAPGGQNKEIVRITAGTTGITDRILSTAAAVGRVVNTVTTTGPNGHDVITAFVSGPGQ
jgi:hypothetical protein